MRNVPVSNITLNYIMNLSDNSGNVWCDTKEHKQTGFTDVLDIFHVWIGLKQLSVQMKIEK